MQVTTDQVLAWRLNRQFLSPRTSAGPTQVASRVCGVQAQVASAARTTIAVRQATPAPITDTTLIRTWAMRGTLHLCTADKVGSYLSLMAEARTWTRPSWQKAFGATAAACSPARDVPRPDRGHLTVRSCSRHIPHRRVPDRRRPGGVE